MEIQYQGIFPLKVLTKKFSPGKKDSRSGTGLHPQGREGAQPKKDISMRFITQIVRRATRIKPELTMRPKARVRGKSPRARLRSEAFSMLA